MMGRGNLTNSEDDIAIDKQPDRRKSIATGRSMLQQINQ